MSTPSHCAVLDRCGGCPVGCDAPATRTERLSSAVQTALRRPPDSVHLSAHTVGWRHRLTLRPAADGRLGLSPPRSHDVLPLDDCPVAHPLIRAALASMPPLAGPSEVELRTDGRRVVCVIRSRSAHGRKRKGRAPSHKAVAAIPEDTVAAVVVDGKRVRGEAALELPVSGHLLRASPGSFFQVHLGMNQQVLDWLAPRVAGLSPVHLLDLYAGIGNLGLTLAPETPGRTLIESSRSAVEDARTNAVRLGRAADIRKADAHRFQAGDAFFDVAVLDPPRRGAGKVVEQLALTRPRAIFYVACDPRALARDLTLLERSGYRAHEVAAFEMFPHSHHLETVAVVTPGGRPLA
mgnify:CR=1 FL=1